MCKNLAIKNFIEARYSDNFTNPLGIVMAKLNNIRPGEVLFKEFLNPLQISTYKLSKDISIPQTRISEIIKGAEKLPLIPL